MNLSEKLKAMTKLAGVSLLAITTTAPFYGCISNNNDMVRILQPRPGVPMPYQDPVGPPPSGDESSSTEGTDETTVVTAPQLAPLRPTQTTDPTMIVDPGTTVVTPPAIENPPIIAPPPIDVDDTDVTTLTPPPIDIEDPLPTVDVKPLTYKVQKGDSWWEIARAYGIGMNELIAYNGADAKKPLQIGKVIKLPPGAKFIPEEDRPTIKKPKTPSRPVTTKPTTSGGDDGINVKFKGKQPIPADGKYTVTKGDSLWVIARRYGLSIKQIMDMNNMKDANLFPNQTLILRDGAAPATDPTTTDPATTDVDTGTGTTTEPAVDGTTAAADGTGTTTEPVVKKVVDVASLKTLPHYIDENETLESIADLYGSQVDWIKQVNPGINTNADLVKGKEINVPIEDVQ